MSTSVNSEGSCCARHCPVACCLQCLNNIAIKSLWKTVNEKNVKVTKKILNNMDAGQLCLLSYYMTDESKDRIVCDMFSFDILNKYHAPSPASLVVNSHDVDQTNL
jgi:hypothetical protein